MKIECDVWSETHGREEIDRCAFTNSNGGNEIEPRQVARLFNEQADCIKNLEEQVGRQVGKNH